MKDLTEKQSQMLDFIKSFTKTNGYAPTVKEIMSYFNFASPTSVTTQLLALGKKGYIKRLEGRARSIVTINDDKPENNDKFVSVPVLDGHVKDGELVGMREDEISKTIDMPKSVILDDNVFFMRVKGDSMIGSHIKDSDLILIKKTDAVKDGDIVIAIVDIGSGQEIVIRLFFKDANGVRLIAENENDEPIIRDIIKIVGKVTTVLRVNV